MGTQDRWHRIQKVLKEAAIENVGVRRNEWFDEECRLAIEHKNEARQKILQRETRRSMQVYKELRSYANRICKKKKWLKSKFQEIEELKEQNEMRKFYHTVGKRRKNFQPKQNACKNRNGVIIRDKQEILQRWAEYYEETLNTNLKQVPGHPRTKGEKRGRQVETEMEVTENPTMMEVEAAIYKLQNN